MMNTKKKAKQLHFCKTATRYNIINQRWRTRPNLKCLVVKDEMKNKNSRWVANQPATLEYVAFVAKKLNIHWPLPSPRIAPLQELQPIILQALNRPNKHPLSIKLRWCKRRCTYTWTGTREKPHKNHQPSIAFSYFMHAHDKF